MVNLAHAQSLARQQRVPGVQLARTRPADSFFDVAHDRAHSTIRLSLRSTSPPYISLRVLEELAFLSNEIRSGKFGAPRNLMLSSQLDGVFSLGGDLQMFQRAVKSRDYGQLYRYGRAAVDQVWSNLSGCGVPGLLTSAVVSGEAQGGGFEAALSCHIVVAERGSSFGFPEPLFGLFPGMGAIELLSARIDRDVAARMVSTPERYSGEFLHEIGVIDYLVPKGRGIEFTQELMALPVSEASLKKISRLKAIRYGDLLSSVEKWTESAMKLSERNLRSMGYLLSAQRVSRHGSDFLEAI